MYSAFFMNLHISFSPLKDQNKTDLYLNIQLVPHRKHTPSPL
jgi:hypothetical protein